MLGATGRRHDRVPGKAMALGGTFNLGRDLST
jgi:hypothetical protein